MVVKKDGRRESFDRKKLRAGLVKACEKRPVSPAQLDAIVDSLETLLHDTEEREMATSDLGARVMDHLRDLDKVAYVRFASVYRKFEDVDEFLLELKNLLGRADAKATPLAGREATPVLRTDGRALPPPAGGEPALLPLRREQQPGRRSGVLLGSER
jgi:hypothetical protein